jgi:CHAT domain-containing protein
MAGTVGVARQGFVPCDRTDEAVAADVSDLRRAPAAGPDRARILHNLAISLYSRYRCTSDTRDVDVAIIHARAVLRLMPLRHSDRALVEGNLAMFLIGRRANGDLQEASVIAQRALAFTPPGRAGYAENLAQAAQVEFELFKDENDPARLDTAIEMYTELVTERPLPSPDAIVLHVNYAVARLNRFGTDWSRRDDLDAALTSLTDLETSDLADAPPGTAHAVRTHLIQALSARYQLVGDEADQSRITALRAELDASSDQALAQQNKALLYDNAGSVSLAAYLRTGDLTLLDRAIREQQEALSAVAEGHPNRPGLLGNLGLCKLLRHREQRGFAGLGSDDLSDGLRLAREALDVGSGGVYEAASAGIFGTLVLEESVAAGMHPDPGQVDLAVDLLTRASDGLSPVDPQHTVAEAKLNQALGLRSLLNNDVPGLREAVSGFDAAYMAMPAASPYRAGMHGGLATLLLALAARTGRRDDTERAVSVARLAVRDGLDRHPASAFETALQWGAVLWRLGALDLAGEGYAAALRILHDLTRTQLTATAKDVSLTRARDVTARAAVALAYAGRPQEAAVAVETGRAVALSEALGIEQARILDIAARSHPLLVQAYAEAAAEVRRLQWDPASGLAGSRLNLGQLNLAQVQLDEQAALRTARQTLDAAIGALEQAMSVELLRPPTDDSLQNAVRVAGVPVVYLVATEIGGSAVIVEAGAPIQSVRLPALTESRVAEISRVWMHAADNEDHGSADRAAHLMWTDAIAPVVAALHGQPQATLVPVGGLGILPLHAAGWQGADGAWHYAADIVSLGYAPNARVLAVCSQRAWRLPDRPALLVADPQTGEDPGSLPSAIEECEELRRRLPETDVIAHLYRADATLAEVLSYLPRAALMHFACHAAIDRYQVLDSAIILAGGGRLSLREILRSQLPMARLAVLSACDSALVGADLQDEVVSFPSALAQAGVAGVVGSLWAVEDVATAVLLTRFYDLWLAGGLPGPAALAQAQRWLRSATNGEIAACYPEIDLEPPTDAGQLGRWRDQRDFASPLWWAPFIFVGA